MSRALTFLTGMPGAGKSTFCRYLEDRHGFAFLCLEDPRNVPWERQGVNLWHQGLARGNAREFVRELRRGFGHLIVMGLPGQ